jgi:hypothetical protein
VALTDTLVRYPSASGREVRRADACGLDPSLLWRRVGYVEEGGSSALHSSIPPIVPPRRRDRGMSRHLLHGGQVDAQVKQVPDPGPAQVVRRRRLDPALEPALATDPPGAAQAAPRADRWQSRDALRSALRGGLHRSYVTVPPRSPSSDLLPHNPRWQARLRPSRGCSGSDHKGGSSRRAVNPIID